MPGKMQTLIDTATPYWDVEAEIARRFYKGAKRSDHAFYLRAQLWKELNPVDGFFNGLHRELTKAANMFPRVGKNIDRHDYLFLLEQLVSEYNHFVLLADILEYIQGRKISKRDLKQLPQEKKLAEIRRNFVKKGGPIGKAAVGITEGGGTALFRVGKNLKGSKINKMTAQAMRVIWNDEKQHYLVQAKEAAGIVKTSNDMKIMKSAIVDVSLQRVWMRNEMFMEPMAKKEIENFLARRR
ncbi:MAG: hypothetical protein VX780_12420 [Pseudomonadota bacterium]|jgi:hypothetical protein|nr:hypothetical protein [Pseudomonadota bacterium]